MLIIVEVTIKARKVNVKGPLGSLERTFRNMQLDINVSEDKKSVKIDLWFGNRENISAIR
jgi:ribosomal protein L6P/L9E